MNLRVDTITVNGYVIPASCSLEQLELAKKNAHELDAHIFFDEEPHIYYIRGKCDYISCTTIIHDFFEHFDGDEIAKKMASKTHEFKEGGKYFKKYGHIFCEDKEELIQNLKDAWEINRVECASLGTTMHRNIELFYNNVSVKDESIEFQHFLKFHEIQKLDNLVPHRTEWVIYDEEYKVCGSIDMIYKDNETGDLHMVDWKRSKEIRKFGFKKGIEPLKHIPDCNYYHYSLQLNLYKYILEKNYSVKIASMRILVCHPKNDSFMEFKVGDYSKEIQDMLNKRKDDRATKKQRV